MIRKHVQSFPVPVEQNFRSDQSKLISGKKFRFPEEEIRLEEFARLPEKLTRLLENPRGRQLPPLAISGDILLLRRDTISLTWWAGIPILQSPTLKPVLKNVNRPPDLRLARSHTGFARLLSFLLLGFIVYGTTVEAAHRHSNVVGQSSPGNSSSVSNPGTGNKLDTSLAGCGECLICQLHQQFSASLIAARHGSSPARPRLEICQSTSTILLTRTNAPRTGRAPPFTS